MSDIIYYNLTIGTNGNGIVTQNTSMATSSQVSIIAQNTLPILDNPEDYYGSIVRLNIMQLQVPIAYFDVLDVNTDPNVGIYSFTLSYNGTDITERVRWVQADFSQPLPTSAKSYYYFMYSYEEFLDCWNTALETAYAALTVLYPLLPPDKPPFFHYDPSSQQMSLYTLKAFADTDASPRLEIYCNSFLTPYIQAFRYDYFNDPVKTARFVVKSYPNPNYPLNQMTIPLGAMPVTASNNYIVVQQEAVSLNYWNMLRNVIVTTSMAVQLENFYEGTGSQPLGQNLLLQSVLTDYIPDLTAGNQAFVSSSQFIYNAQALWRLFVLNQRTPLFNISASVYFTDQNDNTWPMELFTKQQCNIKFMFIKKSLAKHMIGARL